MYEHYPNPIDEPPEWLRRRKTKEERPHEKLQDKEVEYLESTEWIDSNADREWW